VPFGQKGLVVTWTIPTPKEAKVTVLSEQEADRIFDATARAHGQAFHPELPKTYTEQVHKAGLFKPTTIRKGQDLVAWEKQYGIEMEQAPLAVFRDYFKSNHEVVGLLVGHPKVPGPAQWKS
jgi:hypothetical protein